MKKDAKKRLVSSFTLTANYKHQKMRDQLDFGGYFSYSPVLFGLWYRGLPVKNITSELPNNDAIIVLVGYSKNGFTLGYSYDLTVSKLTAATSGGAHEISISLEMASRKSQRKRRRVHFFTVTRLLKRPFILGLGQGNAKISGQYYLSSFSVYRMGGSKVIFIFSL